MDFWTEVLNGIDNNTEKIITVLKARGFFINHVKGNYYLSDNISNNDLHFLKNGLTKYKLGRINDSNKYQERRRYFYNEDFNRFELKEQYKMFQDNSIQLIIDDNAKLEDAISFFYSIDKNSRTCGQSNVAMINVDESFQNYWLYDRGSKPELGILEPNIALYVKAISACGVRTCESCDGNHKNGKVIFVRSNKPSSIWHKYIWNNIVIPKFGEIPFIEEEISFNHRDRDEKYYLIYLIANYLYDNQSKIIDLKRKSVDSFKNRYHYDKSYEDLLIDYEEECNNIDFSLNK